MKIGEVFKGRITNEEFVIEKIEKDNLLIKTIRGKFQTNIETFKRCIK